MCKLFCALLLLCFLLQTAHAGNARNGSCPTATKKCLKNIKKVVCNACVDEPMDAGAGFTPSCANTNASSTCMIECDSGYVGDAVTIQCSDKREWTSHTGPTCKLEASKYDDENIPQPQFKSSFRETTTYSKYDIDYDDGTVENRPYYLAESENTNPNVGPIANAQLQIPFLSGNEYKIRFLECASENVLKFTQYSASNRITESFNTNGGILFTDEYHVIERKAVANNRFMSYKVKTVREEETTMSWKGACTKEKDVLRNNVNNKYIRNTWSDMHKEIKEKGFDQVVKEIKKYEKERKTNKLFQQMKNYSNE